MIARVAESMTLAADAEKEPAWCDPMRHGLAFEFDHEFAAQSVKSLFLARMSMRRCTRARRFIAEEQGNEPTAARNRRIRAQDPDITSADPGGRDHPVGGRDAFSHS